MQDQVSALHELIQQMDKRTKNLETSVSTPSDTDASRQGLASAQGTRPAHLESFSAAENVENQSPVKSLPSHSSLIAQECQVRGVAREVGAELELSLSTAFNTPFSPLLAWHPIRCLKQHHLERAGFQYVNEFPIRHEQNRDPLASHLRASYTDEPKPAKGPCLGDGAQTSTRHSDFADDHVWLYARSFQDEILQLYPVIQPFVLDGWVSQFLDSLKQEPNVSRSRLPETRAGRFLGKTAEVTRGSKRKRVPAMENGELRWPRPDRSMNRALVLTILALGKN